MSSHGPYTEKVPMYRAVDSLWDTGWALFQSREHEANTRDSEDWRVETFVPLSDAERMREELETEKAISEGIADDRERMREALEEIVEVASKEQGPADLLPITSVDLKARAALNPEQGK